MAISRRSVPSFLSFAQSLGERISLLAIWAIVALVFFQVFFRYVLGIGLAWPDEMARYFHILIVFLCLGSVTRDDRHIRIDILSRRLASEAIDVFLLFTLFFTAVVLVAGAAHVMTRIGGLRTPAAGMPIFLFFLPVLIGFAMVALGCVRQLLAPARDAGGPEPGGSGIVDGDEMERE